MKAYHCKGRKHSAFILDTYGQFQTTIEEFKRIYGLRPLSIGDPSAYLRNLTDVRMSLYKDKTRLDLTCNPMTDDLALVFSEWISKQPGFLAVAGPEFLEGVPIEEYVFPF